MAHVPSRYTIREVLIVKRFICVCLFFLLILTAAFADDTPTLRIWGAYYDESIQHTHLLVTILTSVTVHLLILQLLLHQKIQTLMFSSLKLTLVLIK